MISIKMITACCLTGFLLSANASAALVDGSTLNFSAFNGADGSAMPVNGSGSWFAVEVATYGVTGISSFDGLVVGSTQTATGSHSGGVDGTESPTIDNAHTFFNNTGMLSTVSDTNIISASGNTATLDFSGIRWSWGGTDNIVISDSGNADSAIANITCAVDCANGDTYILDYIGFIENASPSGLGGEEVRIHLEGSISAVPVPAAVWLFISGFAALTGLTKRRQK